MAAVAFAERLGAVERSNGYYPAADAEMILAELIDQVMAEASVVDGIAVAVAVAAAAGGVETTNVAVVCVGAVADHQTMVFVEVAGHVAAAREGSELMVEADSVRAPVAKERRLVETKQCDRTDCANADADATAAVPEVAS